MFLHVYTLRVYMFWGFYFKKRRVFPNLEYIKTLRSGIYTCIVYAFGVKVKMYLMCFEEYTVETLRTSVRLKGKNCFHGVFFYQVYIHLLK